MLLVSPGTQQEPDHVQVALVAGQGQSGLLELHRVSVDVGSEPEEELGHTCGGGGGVRMGRVVCEDGEGRV